MTLHSCTSGKRSDSHRQCPGISSENRAVNLSFSVSPSGLSTYRVAGRELYSHWDKTLLKDEIVIHVGSEENEPTNSKGLMRCFWALPQTTKRIHHFTSHPTSIISSPSRLLPINLLPATYFPSFAPQARSRLSTSAKPESTARAFPTQVTPTMSFPSGLLNFVGLCDQARSGDVPQSPTCSNASSGTNVTIKTDLQSFSTLDNDMLEVDSLLGSSKDAESFSDTADHWQELDDVRSVVGSVELVFDDVPVESPSPSFSDCSDVQQSCSARHTARILHTHQQESLNVNCVCGRCQARGSLCAGSSHSLHKEGTGGCEVVTKDEKLSSDSVESIAERDPSASIDSDLQADSSGSESSMRANASRSSLSIGLFGDSRTSSALCLSPNFPDSDCGHVYPPASGHKPLASSCASISDSAADCVPSISEEDTDRSRVYQRALPLQSPTKLRGLFAAARRRVKSFAGAEGAQKRRPRHRSFSDMLKLSKEHATDDILGGTALLPTSSATTDLSQCTERVRSDTLRPYQDFPGPPGPSAAKLAEPNSKRARRMSLPVNTGFVRRMSSQFGWLDRDENPEPSFFQSSTRTSPKKAKQLRARLSSTFTFRDLNYRRVERSGTHTACVEADFEGGRQARGMGAPVRPMRGSDSLLSLLE